MAVTTTVTSANFTGTGVSSTYAPGFYVNSSDQVVVTVNGVVQTLGDDYVVNNVGASTGCDIVGTFALGSAIYVERVTPITQLVDTQNNETILEDVLDAEFDKLTMIAQEIASKALRAILVPKGEAGYTLPVAASRANRFLSFDANGDVFLSQGTGTDAGLRGDLSGAAGAGLIGTTQGTTVQAQLNAANTKLGNLRFVTDPLYNAVGDGVTDATAAIQAAIDAGGSATVIVPPGTYRADGLRLDGSGGNLNNVTLFLMEGARIRARAAATNNVIEAITGSGHKIKGPGRISGSKDTGGTPIRGPSKGLAVTGVAYVLNDRVEVSSADAYTGVVAASNKVYRATTGFTSAASFATDLGAGRWVLVDEPNLNTADLSYRYRNGVYFGAGTYREIDGPEIDQCVYACINLGSGPVQAANIGAALQHSTVHNVYLHDSENGIAGGNWQDCLIDDFRTANLDIYGVVIDIQCASNRVRNGRLIGKVGSLDAIHVYSAQATDVEDMLILGTWTNGVIVDNAALYTNVSRVRALSVSNIGIFVRNSLAVKLNDVSARGCTGAGFDIRLTTAPQLNGCFAYGNGGAGFLFTSVTAPQLTASTTMFNTGAGIQAVDCAGGVFTGNVSRSNARPFLSSGTSTGAVLTANDFSNNTAGYSAVGVNVTYGNLGADIGASHVGVTLAAATTPSAFSAAAIADVRDSGGTARKMPLANVAW